MSQIIVRTDMPRKKELTPDELFEWADGYARSSEAAGHGTKYPTLRMAARSLFDSRGDCSVGAYA